MSIRISIIIPTKNAEKHIKKCIGSILSQSLESYEILVVDYKSTDKTKRIVSKFDSPKVKWIEHEESGIYSAMNKGVIGASGEWILFLGADDFLSNSTVLYNLFLENTSTDLILGKVQNINRHSNNIREVYQNNLSKSLFWRNTIHHQGIIYNKEILMKNPFNTSYNILADYDLNLKLLNKRITFTYKDILISQSNAGGVSKDFTKKLYKEELKLKKEHLPKWAYTINVILVMLKFWIKG